MDIDGSRAHAASAPVESMVAAATYTAMAQRILGAFFMLVQSVCMPFSTLCDEREMPKWLAGRQKTQRLFIEFSFY
jgi:hypothetical protein